MQFYYKNDSHECIFMKRKLYLILRLFLSPFLLFPLFLLPIRFNPFLFLRRNPVELDPEFHRREIEHNRKMAEINQEMELLKQQAMLAKLRRDTQIG